MMSMGLKRRLLVSWLGSIVAYAGVALAQQAPDTAQQNARQVAAGTSDETLQEVIVTANRREQNIQDVPISVVAVSKSGHRRAGYQDRERPGADGAGADIITTRPAVSATPMFPSAASPRPWGLARPASIWTTCRCRRATSAVPWRRNGVPAVVRPGARRGSARTAGHAVRWLLGGRHAAFHQPRPEFHRRTRCTTTWRGRQRRGATPMRKSASPWAARWSMTCWLCA